MRILADDLEGAEIRALLHQHMAHMLANSPKDSCHFLDLSGLRQPNVHFWSIWDRAALAGMGALKIHDAHLGEIKSMRTADGFLRRGVAAQMLAHIIGFARGAGLSRLALETGSGAAFDAAHALYLRFGFAYGPPFADYVDDPFSRFMTLEL
ncbi:MAG: GNAT family N-acetyltransferase [Sphingomonadaceae bacterium]|nr:GNAT family N-acetyltransferase [Sphingomonadaceae bacterium]